MLYSIFPENVSSRPRRGGWTLEHPVYGKDESDIPTFDGAEFSGEKPKSDETLLNLMKMLRIPHEYRARFLKEEKEYDRKRFKNSRTAESQQKGMKLSPLIVCCK